MNADNYNKAIDRLVFYIRMAVLAAGTPTYTAYIGKLSAGSNILGIASGKDFDEVERDVREAYDSKYRR
jgi:hypothetical protein